MKSYRKNRTQSAQSFWIDSKIILGFLVGKRIDRNNNTVQTIEMLTGKIINVTAGNSVKNSEVANEEFEEVKSETPTTITIHRIYKSGETYTQKRAKWG